MSSDAIVCYTLSKPFDKRSTLIIWILCHKKASNFLSLCAGSWRDCIWDFLNHRLYGCNGLRTWKCDIHTETRGSRDLGLTSPRGYFDVAWQKLWHKNGVFWSLTSSWEKWAPVAVCRVTKISLSMWTFSLYFSFIFLFIFPPPYSIIFPRPFPEP